MLFIQGGAGIAVDRYGVRWVFSLSLLSSGVIAAIASFIADFHIVIVLSVTLQLLNIFKPFIRSCVFVLVSQLANENTSEELNARLSVSLQAGQMVGILFAGILVKYGSIPLVMQVISILFFIALFLL